MRLKSFDNFLIASMSAVALMCLYMLYGAKLVTFNSGSEIRVASIVEQLKTVKRKRDFYQGWIDVKPGDALSQNDEIYTHGQSSTKISFVNGPEISLFENSLLRIKTIAKGSTISLDKGNMTAKLNKENPNLDIELNGKKYSFTSQNANIQIEQGATENKFLLLDGSAKMANQEILPNQVVIQNIKTGNLQIKEIPAIPKLPVHNFTQYYLKETNLNFSWAYTNSALPIKIVVARDSKFENVVYEEVIEENSHSIPFHIPGTYFWKLSSQDLVDGPIKTFTLIEETPLVINTDQTSLYLGPKSQEKVFLNWSKNNGKKFAVKLQSPDGKNEIVNTAKNNFEFLPKSLGEYSVSVKINDDNRPLALWSEPIIVTMYEASAISITSLTPELIEKVNYNKQATNYLLSWNGPSNGVSYKVKVTHNNKLMELETAHSSIPLNLKEAGEYLWEVQGETISGVLSNKISGKITIKAPLNLTQLPREGAVIELEKPDQLVAFKWDKVDDSAIYQFELSDEASFKKIILARDVESNNISTSLAETGRYFWRVKVKKGNSVEYSNPVSVEIKPSPPLSRPEVTPEIKIKLKYQEQKSSSFNLFDLFVGKANAADPVATAEWDLPANSKAKSYVVEIYKNSSLKDLITRIETEVPHVIWKNATPGVFYWRVSYKDFWGRSTAFSKISILSTEADLEALKPAPVEIEFIAPKHKADILQAEEDQEIFSWNAIPEAKSYQVFIASDLEFENIIFKKTVSKSEIKITCKDFDNRAGEYYWKVISGDNLSKRRMIRVECTSPAKVEASPVVEKSLEQTAVVKIKEEKANPHFLRLGMFPHHIGYQNKGSQYTAKVDGNAFNSWYGTYQTPTNFKYFEQMNPSLFISRGKVFETITFTDMELNLKLKRLQSSFAWGPVVAFMKKTIYVESNLKITDESISAPLLGVFYQREVNNLTFNAEIKAGSIINIHGDIQCKLKNQFSLGVFVDATSLSKDNNKHNFNSYGLNLSYTFDFLDKTK